jgi:hypothetical protein
MDPMAVVFLVAMQFVPPRAEDADLDAPMKASRVDLESPYLHAQVMAAMASPYKYGVTQMPCKAQALQPSRDWHPAREPSGKIQWVAGPVTKVFWSGIYGTCLIQSPLEREKAEPVERAALECECNGWLPAK